MVKVRDGDHQMFSDDLTSSELIIRDVSAEERGHKATCLSMEGLCMPGMKAFCQIPSKPFKDLPCKSGSFNCGIFRGDSVTASLSNL